MLSFSLVDPRTSKFQHLQACIYSHVACQEDDPAAVEAMARLKERLTIWQSVPSALGRSSLKHKVHAMAHALRLTSGSWQSTARLLRSTLTFTGDLGPESKFPLFACKVSALFGDWCRHEAGALGDADNQLDDQQSQPTAEAEFTFVRPSASPQADAAEDFQSRQAPQCCAIHDRHPFLWAFCLWSG